MITLPILPIYVYESCVRQNPFYDVNLLVYLKENLGKIKIPKLPPKSDKEGSEDEGEEEDGVLIDNLHDV